MSQPDNPFNTAGHSTGHTLLTSTTNTVFGGFKNTISSSFPLLISDISKVCKPRYLNLQAPKKNKWQIGTFCKKSQQVHHCFCNRNPSVECSEGKTEAISRYNGAEDGEAVWHRWCRSTCSSSSIWMCSGREREGERTGFSRGGCGARWPCGRWDIRSCGRHTAGRCRGHT